MSGTRPLALLTALLVVVQVLLALSAPTALLLVVAYTLFGLAITSGATVDAFGGRPTRCRRWASVHLVGTLLVVAALDVGARTRGSALGYWGIPFAFVLATGWIPTALAFGLGALAVGRARSRTRTVVRARRRALRAEEPTA